MADGWITIGTELATDKFDRQVNDLEKKIKKEEEKKVVVGTKLSTETQELEEARRKTDELADAYQRLNKVKGVVAQGRATPGQFETMQDLERTYGTLDQINTKFERALISQEKIEQKVMSTQGQYDALNGKVDEYKNKIESVKMQKQVADVERLKNSFKGVGSNIQSSVKSVGRMVLGIFAIRSAYSALRSYSSQLASYDKQYAANLEYIRFALAQSIAPVLKWILNLAYQVLQVIGMIVNALFGVNIFGKASAKDFQKMKAGASGTAKAAKEIKKQLAGFDEMNILQDTSDTGGGGGGGGGASMPEFDLSKLQGDVPPWLQWIKDNRELVLGFLAGLLTFLTLIRLGINAITALGIGLMVWGVVTAVLSLLSYLKEPTWANFGKIIQGIGIFIIGLGVAFLGLPAIVVGVAVLILGTVIKYWEQIKAKLQGGIDWLTSKSDWIHDKFGDTIGNIYDMFVNNLQLILNWFDSTFTALKGILDGLIMFVKGVFTGDWKMAWEGIKKIFSNIWTAMKNTFLTVFNLIQNKVIVMGQTVGNILASAFKAIVNGVMTAIENVLNSPIRHINSLISVINEVPGINLSPLSTFSLPRLKVGGIINMPNKGKFLGGAIGGESGAEGVIPLTDAQAMETLGEAIGRYITINANIVNSMNGRVISRQLKTIKNEQDFAYNT